MPETINSNALTFMLAIMAVSLAVLFLLFQKHVEGRPLLAYEPRRSVPWTFLAVLLAMFVPPLVVFASLGGEIPTTSEISTDDFIRVGWFSSAANLGYVAIAIATLALYLHADRRDLGLPTRWKVWRRDIGIGAAGCLVAMLPVYLIQLALVVVLQPKEQHPLFDQLKQSSGAEVLVVGFVMAVIAAPIYEEFTFRLLLQGWLEKVEDRRLGYRPVRDQPVRDKAIDLPAKEPTIELFSATTPELAVDTVAAARPTHGLIADLPHGWMPILVSGLIFGLAHFGHGVAPVPLVLFGIILGYLYQRTHRLLPSVIAHMLFNAYSMTLFWLHME